MYLDYYIIQMHKLFNESEKKLNLLINMTGWSICLMIEPHNFITQQVHRMKRGKITHKF